MFNSFDRGEGSYLHDFEGKNTCPVGLLMPLHLLMETSDTEKAVLLRFEKYRN